MQHASRVILYSESFFLSNSSKVNWLVSSVYEDGTEADSACLTEMRDFLRTVEGLQVNF